MPKETISSREATRFFLLATAAPIIRVVPAFTAKVAKEGAILSGIIGSILGIIVAIVLSKIFASKKVEVKNLQELLNKSFGRIVAVILMLLTFITLMLNTAVSLRVFTERVHTIVFSYTVPSVLLIAFLTLILIISKLDLKILGRFAELVEVIMIISFAVVIAICMQNFDIENFWPITIYDIPNALIASSCFISGVSSYTFIFYLGEHISEKEKLKVYSVQTAILIGVVGTGIICITVGSFGSLVTTAFSQPFFMALKSSNILAVFEGIESTFVTFWIIADVFAVLYNVVICSKILQEIFKTENRKNMVTPIIFTSYILAFMLANNFYKLASFSIYIILPLNILLGLIVPIVAYAIAKWKKQDELKEISSN